MNILSAFIIITAMGLILGLGLAFAAKKLAVVKNEVQEKIEEALPGANCGSCGFAGCSAYAEAIFSDDDTDLNLCVPGGPDVASKIGEIMGKTVEVGEFKKQVAYVFCNGNCDSTNRDFDYQGIEDCNAAAILFDGENSCKEGCLHLGSCISVCPVGALSYDEKKNIIVDRELCIACGKCVDICPHNVIKLVDDDAEYVVACNNHESGGKVRKECSVGCIGCKICEKKFPESGCTVENFLSTFDNDIPHSQIAEAAEACPSKCIVKRR